MPIGGDNVGTGFVPIKPDTEGFGPELERGLEKEGAPAASRAGQKMSAAMKGAFLGGVALLGKSVMDFAGFDTQMREVFTLMPGITGPAMSEMTEQVKTFSAEFGVLPNEVVPALYSSLSAGVPADNVFSFLETAQKLAKGGVTELETAVDGLSSVVNAYGADVITAEQASDLMFTTVKLGKTTIGELSGALFNVIPTASGLGVAFSDVSAALSTVTAAGTPTSVATTQIRQLLVELGKEGTKVADIFEARTGKSFRQFIEDGGDLQSGLAVITDEANETGASITDLFGSVEAGAVALTLTGAGAEKFNADLLAMNDSAGATDAAFDVMNQGLGATLDRLKAKFSVVLLDIGENIAPSIGVIGEAIGGVLEILGALPGPITTAIVLFGTLFAGMAAFAGPILKAITLFSKLSGVMTLLATNPWVLAALAIVAVGVLIYKNWDTIKEKGEQLWQWFTVFSTNVANDIEAAWNRILEITSGVFTAIGNFFAQWWPLILGIFTGGIGLVVGLVIQNWDAITAKTSEVAASIAGFFTSAWNTVQSVTSSVGGAVVGFIVGIPNAITGAFSTLAGIISSPFTAAFNTIKTTWNATVGGFGFTAPSWVPGFGGKGFTIPSMAAGGVLDGPQLFLGGEYVGAARDPEIVAPQSIIRTTMIEALTGVGGAPGGGGLVVHGPLIGQATIRDDRDITELSRELAREVERRQRGAGKRVGGVNRG